MTSTRAAGSAGFTRISSTCRRMAWAAAVISGKALRHNASYMSSKDADINGHMHCLLKTVLFLNMEVIS